MPNFGLKLFLRATGASVTRAGATAFSGVSIDGRAVPTGGLYFAVRGERFDGKDFVEQAESSGAIGVVVARGQGMIARAATKSAAVFEVDEPILALGRLAREYRRSLPKALKVVALTGSVGKTSCKEMIAAILSAATSENAVHKTRGNLNNHLGVPLTLLEIESSQKYAVIEMGMSSLGEIAYLEAMTAPDVALVTNVASVHIEQLGSLENVARAKGEIFAGRVAAGHAIAVSPFGEKLLDHALCEVPQNRCVSFGGDGADVCVKSAKLSWAGTDVELSVAGHALAVRLPVLGVHHAQNAAAAAAVAYALGVDPKAIELGLASVRGEKHRMQRVDIAGRSVLDDCYNASPPSVRAALDALAGLATARRVAILGDMLELGEEAPHAHAEIGRYAAERADVLICVGALSQHTAHAARERMRDVVHLQSCEEAARHALSMSAVGDVLLVKASRGMKFERIIDAMAATVKDLS